MQLLFMKLALCFLSTVLSLDCFWDMQCPYKFFASKCLYDMIRGDIRDSVLKFEDCEPISIWMIMRHGKRHPSHNFVREMNNTIVVKDYIISSYEKGHSSLCAQDIDNLREWVLDEEVFINQNQLSAEGYIEMVGLGRRLMQAFPKLLANLSVEDYTFRPLNSPRIIASMKGFVEGFGNKNYYIEPAIEGYDNLAPFKSCDKFLNEVIINNATFKEVRRYMQSFEYLMIKDTIQRRLGIDYTLTDDNIQAIYNFCRSNSSGVYREFSPWCALLTTRDLMAMEYIEDLKHYYRNGYGAPKSHVFGEIILSDLLIHFRKAKSAGKKITAYMTDSTLLDMLYTALGLFKDDYPITGEVRIPDRKWRTSRISTFCSNFVAVLYRCGGLHNNNFKVVFYLNEKPLETICNKGICSWNEFEDKLRPFLDAKMDFC